MITGEQDSSLLGPPPLEGLTFLEVKSSPEGGKLSCKLPGEEAPLLEALTQGTLEEALEARGVLVLATYLAAPSGKSFCLVAPRLYGVGEETFTGPLSVSEVLKSPLPEGSLLEKSPVTGEWSLSYRKEGRLHREGAPAVLAWDASGTLLEELWYLEGMLSRREGPSSISRQEASGNISLEWSFFEGIRDLYGGVPEGMRTYLEGTVPLEEVPPLFLKNLELLSQALVQRGAFQEVLEEVNLAVYPERLNRHLLRSLLTLFLLEEYLKERATYGEMPLSWWLPLAAQRGREALLQAWRALGEGGNL